MPDKHGIPSLFADDVSPRKPWASSVKGHISLMAGYELAEVEADLSRFRIAFIIGDLSNITQDHHLVFQQLLVRKWHLEGLIADSDEVKP